MSWNWERSEDSSSPHPPIAQARRFAGVQQKYPSLSGPETHSSLPRFRRLKRWKVGTYDHLLGQFGSQDWASLRQSELARHSFLEGSVRCSRSPCAARLGVDSIFQSRVVPADVTSQDHRQHNTQTG